MTAEALPAGLPGAPDRQCALRLALTLAMAIPAEPTLDWQD